MFCKNCGAKINKKDSECKNCGYKNIELTYVDKYIDLQLTQKPKNNKTVLIIAIVIMTVLILALIIGSICIILTLNSPKTTANEPSETTVTTHTETTTPLEINIEDYYISGGSVTYIADPNNPVAVTFTNENDPDSDPQSLVLNENKYAFDGQTFYCQQHNNNVSEFYKYTFTTKTTCVKSVWVTQDNLKKYLFGIDTYIDYGDGLACWEYYDNYIYFSKQSPLYGTNEFGNDILALTDYKLPHLLIKISTDGKTIEIDDQIVNDLTIKDGFIYYYDSGLTELTMEMTDNNGYTPTYYIDFDRVGIYKMDSDGNNKQLIKAGNVSEETKNLDINSLYIDLEVFGDYLYFKDNSKDGNGRVCRMKLDGTDFEYLTTNPVSEFTVDEKSNTLYYSSVVIREAQKIIQLSLKDKTEKEIVSVDVIRDSKLNFKNNSLYFSNNYLFESSSKELSTSGARYNLSTNKLEYLQRFYEFEEIKDDIFTKQIVKGPYFYWEETTNNNGYFKQ